MAGFTIHVNDKAIKASSTYNALQIYNVHVDIVRVTRANTAHGMPEGETTLVANHPATIKWTSGKEKMRFGKETHYLDGILRCRVVAGVTIDNKDSRVIYNGKRYEIVDVQDFRNLGRLLVIGIRKIE